ncbi:hypothetical protein D3C76_300660 [compost metagenome]
MQFHDPVWLAQVAVGIVGVDHHEARIKLAAHGVEVGTADQVGHGRGELDHVIGLAHLAQAFRGDQHAAGGAVQDGVDQDRAQGAFAQFIEDLADAKTQERLVLQGLDRPLGYRLDECVDGFLGEFQLKQARRLARRREGKTLGLRWQRHHKVLNLSKGVHGSSWHWVVIWCLPALIWIRLGAKISPYIKNVYIFI